MSEKHTSEEIFIALDGAIAPLRDFLSRLHDAFLTIDWQSLLSLLQEVEAAYEGRLANSQNVYDWPPEFLPIEATDAWLDALYEYRRSNDYFYHGWHDEYLRERKLRNYRKILRRE